MKTIMRENRCKTQPFKKCKTCGADFHQYSSLMKFCSYQCRVANMKSKRKTNWSPEQVEKRLGKNNPAYKHGMKVRGVKIDGTGLRLFFRIRDEYRQEIINAHGYLFCERCGITAVKFEAHHIIYRSEKPHHTFLHDKRNIINLCVKCHNWYHLHKSNRNELVMQRQLHLLFGNDILDK